MRCEDHFRFCRSACGWPAGRWGKSPHPKAPTPNLSENSEKHGKQVIWKSMLLEITKSRCQGQEAGAQVIWKSIWPAWGRPG